MTIRVIVADDQALVRSGLAMILQSQPDIDVVGQADDGADAIALTRAHRPDIALMDIRMPAVDGLAATRTITTDPALAITKVVMLTTYDLDEYLFAALRGCSRFPSQRRQPRRAHPGRPGDRRGGISSSAISHQAPNSPIRRLTTGQPSRSCVPPSIERLTPRELEVLDLMARAYPTARSPKPSSSVTTPSRPTSATSSTNWTHATGYKP